MKKEKIISLVITLTVISLLLFSGPAGAITMSFSSNLSTNQSSPTQVSSSTLTFNVTYTLENADKYVPVSNFTLNITDSNNNSVKECVFDLAGTALSGCSGLSISRLSQPSNYSYGLGYGYGYVPGSGYQNVSWAAGYGYGLSGSSNSWVFEIILQKSSFSAGTYSIKPLLTASGADFSLSTTKGYFRIPSSSSGSSSSSSSSGDDTVSDGGEFDFTSSGTNLNVGEGDEYTFNHGSDSHSLTINSIGSDSVSFTLHSDPITDNIYINQPKYYNLDSDNFYDIYIALQSITGSKAKLMIKQIVEVIDYSSTTTGPAPVSEEQEVVEIPSAEEESDSGVLVEIKDKEPGTKTLSREDKITGQAVFEKETSSFGLGGWVSIILFIFLTVIISLLIKIKRKE